MKQKKETKSTLTLKKSKANQRLTLMRKKYKRNIYFR